MRATVEVEGPPEIKVLNVNDTLVRFETWGKHDWHRTMSIYTDDFKIDYDFQSINNWNMLRQFPPKVYNQEQAETTWMLMKILA
jgi:hypothetical protein